MFFDIEKQEQWLNKQLHKGYRCTHISGLGIYTFEETDKRYVMRMDYQDYLSKQKFKDYKGLYEDFGWVYIAGSRLGGHYWQKEDDNQNEIFSDRQSRSNYYKRLMNYSAGFGLMLLFISYLIFNDSGLYLADGLWSMEGTLFWKAFLFETPFVLLRSIPFLMAVFFGCSFYKAFRKYSTLREG
ncbi:Protein of unknown function [Terribacillus halophilus]|uniref:DUF2812 domain-containing protein n=2 Tax=Terribacillus halophilus TaxID=361279 RepID=A0A1G6VVY7_9BACI|nr:Protein of unknown function [Terribacillus halophilus]